MSFFRQNSFFNTSEDRGDDMPDRTIPVHAVPLPADARNETAISNQQLEDWSHRLHSAAYEAGDHGNEVLESTLLDLRDEVVFELHQRMI